MLYGATLMEPAFAGSGVITASLITVVIALAFAFVETGKGHKMANGHSQRGAARLDLIAALRRAESIFHVSMVLKCTGFSCLAVGLSWAGWVIVVSHPYIVLISIGIACVMAGAICSEAGLLAALPEGFQELLLRKTPFDLLIHDDAPLVNMARRWGRMFLLSSPRSPSEVQHVVAGLQPQFVAWYFRRNVELLPSFMQRLLLPEAEIVMRQRLTAGQTDGAGDQAGKQLQNSELKEILDQKHEEREMRYTEPPLAPVIFQLVMNGLPVEVKYMLAGIALPGYVLSLWEYILAFAVGGWATRLSLRTCALSSLPLARTLFPTLNATADVSLDSTSTRTARTLSALGFLGAGCLALHALHAGGHLRRKVCGGAQPELHE